MDYSIIIPVYNYPAVTETLDSIETQIAGDSRFEVLVIDDASTDNTYTIVKEYIAKRGFDNVRLFHHDKNKRQGGARNTGLEHGGGVFALFLDGDDEFADGVLKHIADYLDANRQLDILMCDSALVKDGKTIEEFHYRSRNRTEAMSGEQFVCTQEVPWVPWLYIYRMDFLNHNNLRFVENVRFEDVDFVLKCTIRAKRIKYQPFLLVKHLIHSSQTTFIANNADKINDLFFVSYRCRLIAETERCITTATRQAILGHHLFSYEACLKRFFWRLPYGKMREILQKYMPYRLQTVAILWLDCAQAIHCFSAYWHSWQSPVCP